MLQEFKNGQTSVVLRFKLLDSSLTTGGGLTGLTSASTGLIISTIADNEATPTVYTVAATNVETITTLGTYQAPSTNKCRFKEVDATNHKGLYELHLANARFAVSNAKSLIISLSGATNLVESDFIVPLVQDDPYVAKPTNSQLLSIDANGRVDVIKLAGTPQTARDIGASVLLSSGTGTGQVSLNAGNVAVDVNYDKTGYDINDKTGFSLAGSKNTLDDLNDLSNAQIKAEVVNALTTDDYAEPGQETPAATTNLAKKINFLYKAWRNRSTQTSSQYSLYNDDATTVDQKATVSDDTVTADKGEVTTGP